MILTCRKPIIKISDSLGNIRGEFFPLGVMSIIQSCDGISTLDVDIQKICGIRKRDKITICDDVNNVIFRGYLYDFESCIENNKTKLKVNDEKWIIKERFALLNYTYTGDYKGFISYLVNYINSVYNEFTYDLSGAGNIDISINYDDNLFDIFDEVAGLVGLSWTVIDGKITFGVLGQERDDSFSFDGTRCDNLLSLCVSEGERASQVIGVDKDGNTHIASDFTQGNLGVVKYEFLNGNLIEKTEQKLKELQGQNLIFKIGGIQGDFNVCDTVNVNIVDCDDYTFNGKIKIQEKKMTYSSGYWDIEYTLSNVSIQRSKWFGYFVR